MSESLPTPPPSKGRRVKKWRHGDKGPIRQTWDRTQQNKAYYFASWIIVGAVFLVGLVAAILLVSDSKKVQLPKEEAVSADEPWQGLLPDEIAKRFIDATSVEERLQWVRDPEEVEPLMQEFYLRGAGAKEKILGIETMEQASTEKMLYHRFQARIEGGDRRLLCVPVIDNRAYVDFKSYARYGSETWADLLSGKKSAAVEVRVFVAFDTAYMNDYTDEKKWLSLTASSPDFEHPLYFYVERDSLAGKQLSTIPKRVAQRVTLGIRSVNNGHEKKQFEISQLHCIGWCY